MRPSISVVAVLIALQQQAPTPQARIVAAVAAYAHAERPTSVISIDPRLAKATRPRRDAPDTILHGPEVFQGLTLGNNETLVSAARGRQCIRSSSMECGTAGMVNTYLAFAPITMRGDSATVEVEISSNRTNGAVSPAWGNYSRFELVRAADGSWRIVSVRVLSQS